jgi:hypothetical protein
MARVSGKIMINRPVEQVFDYVADQRISPLEAVGAARQAVTGSLSTHTPLGLPVLIMTATNAMRAALGRQPDVFLLPGRIPPYVQPYGPAVVQIRVLY